MIHQTLSGALLREAGMITDEDVRAINSLRNPPPAPVSERDVYVRRCRLAGDAVDAYWGCFRTADLPRILTLTQGAPLLVGHDKRSLAIARFFGGGVEEHQGQQYVAPKFYWLRGHSSADDLRVAIDGGLYSEASLSFCYETPTCSLCGKDIRTCEHLPGAPGPDGTPVFYYYDKVVAVLEGSLVYRGAEPGTGFALQRAGGIIFPQPSCGAPLPLPATIRVKRRGKWYLAALVEEEV